MSIRLSRRFVLAVWLVAISMVFTAFAGSIMASAQSSDIGIIFRPWACPDGIPANEWNECDPIMSATYTVEADGVEIADSPVTTIRDTGIGHGLVIHVPQGTTAITVTQQSGAPEGYTPASGYDPLTANVADLPEVGFGGESTGPGLAFFNVPVSTEENDATAGESETTEETSGSDTTTLPSAGIGPEADHSRQHHEYAAAALLLGAGVIFGAACTTRRLHTC